MFCCVFLLNKIQIVIFAVFLLSNFVSPRIVKTSFGRLRGFSLKSYGGHEGYAFLGVPIAEPPIGNLRFKAPKEKEKWNDIWDATYNRNACISDPLRTYKTYKGPISEDCLYANIFASKKCLEWGGCSVMVAIHGGRNEFETVTGLKPEVIINNFANQERNIVVVALPYRLYILGWFNLGESWRDEFPSNVGMRDVLHGLKWVQSEVEAFGGHAQKITMLGHSAGAAITRHLSHSQLAKGLFQRIVVMSSPILSRITKDSNIAASKQITKLLGCAPPNDVYSNDNKQQVLLCLQKVEPSKIVDVYNGQNDMIEVWNPYGIDGEFFLDETSKLKLLPNIDVLTGTTTEEYLYTIYVEGPNHTIFKDRLEMICTSLSYLLNYTLPEVAEDACFTFYNQPGYSKYILDHSIFHLPAYDLVNKVISPGSKAFLYSYSYPGAGKAFLHETKANPSHTEDYIWLFGLYRGNITGKDLEIEKKYTEIFANFVNFGNPSANGQIWYPWNKKYNNYFRIDYDENLTMPGNELGFYEEMVIFWNEIIPKIAGEQRDLSTFPQGFDEVIVDQIAVTAKAHFTKQGDSLYAIRRQRYDIWLEFTLKLVEQYKN